MQRFDVYLHITLLFFKHLHGLGVLKILFPFQETALADLHDKINKAHLMWSERTPNDTEAMERINDFTENEFITLYEKNKRSIARLNEARKNIYER